MLTSDDALAERLRFLQNSIGAVPSPFDCFMVLRGVKTLPVRMERHAKSAASTRAWLEDAAAGREGHTTRASQSHPQHALGRRRR